MAAWTQQLITIAGVLAGSGLTFLAGGLNERFRHRRDKALRLDERRMATYGAYAASVKACYSAALRMAATRGLNWLMLPAEGKDWSEELERLSLAREKEWEQVLLIADPDIIDAARSWHRALWHLEWYARGKVENADEESWDSAVAKFNELRDRYYSVARRGLGLSALNTYDKSWPPSWIPRKTEANLRAE